MTVSAKTIRSRSATASMRGGRVIPNGLGPARARSASVFRTSLWPPDPRSFHHPGPRKGYWHRRQPPAANRIRDRPPTVAASVCLVRGKHAARRSGGGQCRSRTRSGSCSRRTQCLDPDVGVRRRRVSGGRRAPTTSRCRPFGIPALPKRDGTAVRDATTHPYFAGHGYASVRVDMRGNGESDGLMWDEYLVQEQDDALEVIDWLVAQPWCSGTVGMIISWGGSNGLQAMRRPAALKAVVSICSTVDRYADDIHHKGGSLLLENVGWATQMLGYSSRPPDPALLPDNWREAWPTASGTNPSWRKPGSSISAGMTIGSTDRFVKTAGDPMPGSRRGRLGGRLQERGPGPRRGPLGAGQGIIGPWIHKYPTSPCPARIGFLLNVSGGGPLAEGDRERRRGPAGHAGLQPNGRVPAASYDERPGDWVAEQVWPSPNISVEAWHLTTAGCPRGGKPSSCNIGRRRIPARQAASTSAGPERICRLISGSTMAAH